MVYKSRPDAGDALLAWDRFTVLHEAEPLEMEFLAGENMAGIWRFRYLDSTDSPADVRLGVAGLEAVGSPDPDKLRRIKVRWKRAGRYRANVGSQPAWLAYLWFGGATLSTVPVVLTSVYVLRKWSGQPESSARLDVQFALVFLAMAWVVLAAQHLAEWWRKYVRPPWAPAWHVATAGRARRYFRAPSHPVINHDLLARYSRK